MGETVQTTTAMPPPLSGPEKVAVLMLCLGETAGAELMRDLDETEIRSVSQAMFALPPLGAAPVESVLDEFTSAVAAGGAVLGNRESARALLASFLPPEKVDELLRQHAPPRPERDPWRRLGAMEGEALAGLLAPEHPQTVAAILANVPAAAAARALPCLPDAHRRDVVERMLRTGALPDALMDEIERAVREDLLAVTRNAGAGAAQERMADVLGALAPDQFEDMAAHLEAEAPDDYAAVRRRMLTFDDLVRIAPRDLALVIRAAPPGALAPALAEAPADLRTHILSALPTRSRTMLEQEIADQGTVRDEDALAARTQLTDAAKTLIRGGEIDAPPPSEEA